MDETTTQPAGLEQQQTQARNGNWAFASTLSQDSARVASRYNKRLTPYWLKHQPYERRAEEGEKQIQQPPFAVIGMGRCGCHVTTALAQMVTVASGRKRVSNEEGGESSWNLISKLFRSDTQQGVMHLEPVMLVGDIDETTYHDIDGLLSDPEDKAHATNRLLKFKYKPLAVGGAGHVPLFAEYVTRGLLQLPPSEENKKAEAAPWGNAHEYLLDSCVRTPMRARLVFYIFSSGGGTGSGAAAEMMRAQRFAMNNASGPEPQIYFTGFAVLPADVRTSNRRQINTGRMLVEYLADLNIKLDDTTDYEGAPVFQGSRLTEYRGEQKIMMPWDGLALVSNDVMFVEEGPRATREVAETKANQYMAQQMFNLAASQFQTEEYQRDNAARPSALNYQSLRLDPQDLRNGLNGPYAIAFAAVHPEDTSKPGWLERLLIRSISLPRAQDKRSGELVEGISIAPETKAEYAEKIGRLEQALKDRTGEIQQTAEDEAGPRIRLTEAMLSEISAIRMFSTCPRAVFVLTAPQEGVIPADTEEKLTEYLGWLLPNVDTVRAAIVRGTTRFFTLSIYLESSVIMCPEVIVPIMNYIKLCWPKTRNTSASEFMERFNGFISQDPPVTDEAVAEWLGEREHYGLNVANFHNLATSHNRNWISYLEAHDLKDKEKNDELRQYTIDDVYLTPAEVASAIRFINYVYHNRPPETVDVSTLFA